MLALRHPIINGAEVEGSAGARPVVNPASLATVGMVSYGDESQMALAVSSAKQAFAHSRAMPSHERSRILQTASEIINRRREEIAQLIAAESGKPISYARIEAERGIFTFKMAAAAALKSRDGFIMDMTSAPNGVGRIGEYRSFPIGVIAAITPFNFPLNLVAHKVAPAIAMGNTIVLKPAPQTPLTSFLLADILREAGLPNGMLNVVPCENSVAESLVRNESVAMVSFTGSALVGWKLKSMAGHAKVALELGGNGSVILDETDDLDAAIAALTNAAFLYAGQVCISLQTLYVKREIYADVLARMVKSAKSAHVGDPTDATTVVGPMISEGAAKKVEGWIAEAVARGAVRHSGEYRAPNWIMPSVLTDVPRDCALFVEEAFAPIVIIEPYDAIDEAINRINAGKYGLQSGLFSNDMRIIRRVYDALEVGALIVNDSNAFRLDTMPYGGVKSSGFGREGIEFAMREMSELKLLVTK